LEKDEVVRRLVEIGQAIGPPWTQDEKFAALVAWLSLVNPASASPEVRGVPIQRMP
jgi:hypothetical protein